MNQAALQQASKVIADACKPFRVQVNEEHGVRDISVSVHFIATIKDLDFSHPEIAFGQVHEFFDKTIMNTEVHKFEVDQLNAEIEKRDRTIEALQKENGDLRRYKIFYDLYKELKHDAPAHA